MMDDRTILYCGECKDFLNEDTNGYGICAIDGEIRFCGNMCNYGKEVKQ